MTTLLIFTILTLIEAVYVWIIWDKFKDYAEIAKFLKIDEQPYVDTILKFVVAFIIKHKKYLKILYIFIAIINIILASLLSFVISMISTFVMSLMNF